MAVPAQTVEFNVIEAKVKNLPFVYHYGILINVNGRPTVLHNPATGGITVEPLQDFIKTREVTRTNGPHYINKNQLDKNFIQSLNKKYHVLTYNCEDFVNDVAGKKILLTEQKNKFFTVLIAGLLILILKP
jgi:hypothetical protein